MNEGENRGEWDEAGTRFYGTFRNALFGNDPGESDADKWYKANTLARAQMAMRQVGTAEEDKGLNDAQKLAKAMTIASSLIGDGVRDDVFLSGFNGGTGFKDGQSALDKMRLVVKGLEDGPEKDLDDFRKLPYEQGLKIALDDKGVVDGLVHSAGNAGSAVGDWWSRGGGALPLDKDELKEAGPEMVAASDVLRQNAEYESAYKDYLTAGRHGRKVEAPVRQHDEAKVKEATDRVRAWREDRYNRSVYDAYVGKLAKKARNACLSSIINNPVFGSVQNARKVLNDLLNSPDNAVPVEDEDLFAALPGHVRSLIVTARSVMKPDVESGFWNTLGDFAISMANTGLDVATSPYRQGTKLGNMAANGAFDAGIDVNEINRRKQDLYAATGRFFAGGDLESGTLPMMQFEQICDNHGMLADAVIGTASILGYGATVGTGPWGVAAMTLEAMQQMDDHVAAEGGDITNGAYNLSNLAFGIAYGYTEHLKWGGFLKSWSDVEIRKAFFEGYLKFLKDHPVQALKRYFTLGGTEAAEEGLQKLTMNVNEALFLDKDVGRAAAEGFVGDMIETLPSMMIVGPAGDIVGHARRSGFKLGDEGQANRVADMNAVAELLVNQDNLVAMGRQEARKGTEKLAAMYAGLYDKYKEHGIDAIGKAFKLTETQKADLEEFYKAIEAEVDKSGASVAEAFGKVVGKGYDNLFGFKAFSDIADNLLEDFRREYAKGAPGREGRVENWMSDEFWQKYRAAWAKGNMLVSVETKDGQKVETDLGAKELEKLGLGKKAAAKLSAFFRWERGHIFSRQASEAIRDLYDRQTRLQLTTPQVIEKSLKGGRVVYRDGRTFVRYEAEPDSSGVPGSGMREVEIRDVDLEEWEPNFDAPVLSQAQSIDDATHGEVSAEKWMSGMTADERRETWKRLRWSGVGAQGGFSVIDTRSGNEITSRQLWEMMKAGEKPELQGVIRVDPYAPIRATPFHELAHGYVVFAISSGLLTEADVNALAADPAVGPATGRNELFNEENFSNAFRDYLVRRRAGSAVADTAANRAMEKLWSFGKRVSQEGEKRSVDAKVAQTRMQAIFDQIALGVYAKVADVAAKPAVTKKTEKPVPDNGKGGSDNENAAEATNSITDEDFTKPTRDVSLPAMPAAVGDLIGANGRPVLIKKNIFEKNRDKHPELTPDESRRILGLALYNPTLVGQTQPQKRPHYWVSVKTGEDDNATVVVDVYPSKDNVEIVGWRKVNDKGLEKLKRQAEREDGQLLILSPETGSAAALSALPSGKSSAGSISKPAAEVKPAAKPATWEAAVPKSPYRVKGHYLVLKLKDVVSSDDPAYAVHKDWQNRIGENKLAEASLLQIKDSFYWKAYGDSAFTDTGAPIVLIAEDAEGKLRPFVVSGNGRMMVLKSLLKDHMYDRYRGGLKEMAAEMGLEVPEDGEEYVLVRVIDDLGGVSIDEFVTKSNGDNKRKVGDVARAKQDAATIVANGLAPLYKSNVDGTPDMTPGVNDEFFRLFSQRATDGDAIYDENFNVVEEGKNRVMRALLYVSCGQGDRGPETVDKVILMTDTLGIRRQRNAMECCAAAVAALEANPDYAIGADVSRAMADYMDFVEKKRAGKVGTFADYLGEQDMFDRRSDIAEGVLQLLGSSRNAREIADVVKAYCDVATKSEKNGGLMGADAARTREDVWREVSPDAGPRLSIGVSRQEYAVIRSEAYNKLVPFLNAGKGLPRQIVVNTFDKIYKLEVRDFDDFDVVGAYENTPENDTILKEELKDVEDAIARARTFTDHGAEGVRLAEGRGRGHRLLNAQLPGSAMGSSRLVSGLSGTQRKASDKGSGIRGGQVPRKGGIGPRNSFARLDAAISELGEKPGKERMARLEARYAFAAAAPIALTGKDIALAVSKFGTTDDINRGIYFLPDGTMLSGKGKVYTFGGKKIEAFGHDGWCDLVLEKSRVKSEELRVDDLEGLAEYGGQVEAAQKAIYATGAIRISGDKNGFTIAREPTPAQYDAMYDMAEKAYRAMEANGDDTMLIDVTDENLQTLFTLSYPRGTSARRIIDDLRGWYERGEKPGEREQSMLAEFHRWSVAPKGVQKGAAVEYPDAGEELRVMSEESADARWSVGGDLSMTLDPKSWGDLGRKAKIVGSGAASWTYTKGTKVSEHKAALEAMAYANIEAQPNHEIDPETGNHCLVIDGTRIRISKSGLFHSADRRLQNIGNAIANIGDVMNGSVAVPNATGDYSYRIAETNFGRPEFVLVTLKNVDGKGELVDLKRVYSVNVKASNAAQSTTSTSVSRPTEDSIANFFDAWKGLFYGGAVKHLENAKDKDHADAVKRGDMETAARMVREAAAKAGYINDSSYQGTSAFNGAAPSANGYYANKEERKAAWEDGSFEDTQTLGDYIFDGIDIGDLEHRLDNRHWSNARPEHKEAIENLNEVFSAKGKTIRMYRSVPSDVKEGSFRNGDWITPSRSYAVENARIHGWGKKFRIIEQEVSVEDIWWDGNDIAEWGFDDGRESAYKNTKNNRKLLAPATYDDDGNLIPLSQRFDQNKADIRWSIGARRREEFRDLMGRKRPDIAPEDVEAYLDEIAGYESAKKQKLAVHWIITGAIELPEDAYKLDKAIATAERAKVDPFQYRNPEDIFAAFPQHLPKEKPIDPDTVPELTGKTDMGHGVTVYDVQDDRDGQRAMRKVLDTHWGEDANPWCLLARDNSETPDYNAAQVDENEFWDWWENLPASEKNRIGDTDIYEDGKDPEDFNADADAKERARDYYVVNVAQSSASEDPRMRQAWHYWEHYSALPKKVAFLNGRLLAFMATDANGIRWQQFPNLKVEEQWWDRKDASHAGIPIEGKIAGDPLGRSGLQELKNGKLELVGRMWKGDRKNGRYEEWEGEQKKLDAEFKDGRPVGWRRTYQNGELSTVEHYNEKGEHDRPQLVFYPGLGLASVIEYGEGDSPLRSVQYRTDGTPRSYQETGGARGLAKTAVSTMSDGTNVSWTDDAGDYYSVFKDRNGIIDHRFAYMFAKGEYGKKAVDLGDAALRAKLEGESAAVLEAVKAEAAAIYREYSPAAGARGESVQPRASNGAAPSGPRWSFAGRAGAAGLGIDGSDAAEKMEADGADREDIWRKTGWWRGKDGKWRVEVDPPYLASRSKFEFLKGGELVRLGELFPDSPVISAYGLERIPVITDFDGERQVLNGATAAFGFRINGEEGIILRPSLVEYVSTKPSAGQLRMFEKFSPEYAAFSKEFSKLFDEYDQLEPEKADELEKKIRSDLDATEAGRVYEDIRSENGERFIPSERFLSVMTHEIQHIIQDREGFAQGGNPGLYDGAPSTEKIDERISSLNAELDKVIAAGEDREAFDRLRKEIKDAEDEKLKISKEAHDKAVMRYHVLAGEVEARNVEKRLMMPLEKRLATPPWETEDVKEGNQIVRWSIAAGDDLSNPEKADVFVSALKAYSGSKPPARLRKSDPQSAYTWFKDNLLGKTFPLGGRSFTVKEGHFFRFVCEEPKDGRRKGWIDKATSPDESRLMIERGEVSAEDIAGYVPARAASLPFALDVLTSPDAIIRRPFNKTFKDTVIKKFNTGSKTSDLAVFILNDDGKTLGLETVHRRQITKGFVNGNNLIAISNEVVESRSPNPAGSRLSFADNAGDTSANYRNSISNPAAADNPLAAIANAKTSRDVERAARMSFSARLADGDEGAAERALVNYVAYHKLTGGAIPRATTLAKLGLALGMKTVQAKRIIEDAQRVADRAAGSVIEKAARNGDVGTAFSLMEREKEREAELRKIVSGGAKAGGDLVLGGVVAQGTLLGKRIEQTMRGMTAATLADMEGDTGLDLAAEILQNDPKAFDDELKPTKPQRGDNAEGAIEQSEQSNNPQPLSDYERWKRSEAKKEAAKRVQAFIEAAKRRAEENRRKAEEHRAREAARMAAGEDPSDGGESGGGSTIEQSNNPNNSPTVAGFKNKWEFAAFVRKWAEDKYAKTHGLTTFGRSEENRLFAEFYRICVVQQLQDLADKLLDPKGARAWANRRIGELEKGLKPDTIERASADIFAFINRNAIREERVKLIEEFRKEIKQFITGAEFEELKQDSTRRLTGWVEEAARYMMKVCQLSGWAANGGTSQFERERQRLVDIIQARRDVYAASGADPSRAEKEDKDTIKAMWMLPLLEKFGAMAQMMPGEIEDLKTDAIRYLTEEAAALEEIWRDTKAKQEDLRRKLAGGVEGPNGQKFEEGFFEKLFDSLNGMLRLRLKHLVRFAGKKERADAEGAIDEIVTMLGQGEVAYAREVQKDRREFMSALARIFQDREGRPNRRAIRDYIKRMEEPIPVELSRQISNQGYAETMTYGQMLQLLVSLEQKSYAENVKIAGREGQAELIRSSAAFTTADALFIDWIRAFYAAKRETISKVTERMTGMKVESPDPLYCPVKTYRKDVASDLHIDAGRWNAIDEVLSSRVRHTRDFDESASILGQFYDRSNRMAGLVAWAERGTLIQNVICSSAVQQRIRLAFGESELAKIRRQLEDTFNGGTSRSKTPGEIIMMDKAMNFITFGYLGFNPLSAIKQTTSFPVWANVLPGGFRELWHHMTHIDREAVRHIMESDEYKVRYGDDTGSGQDFATKALNENAGQNPFMRLMTGPGMWLLKKGDFLPGVWIMQGVYKSLLNKHLNEGMEETAADKLALTEAFNLLEETQQSGRTYNTNALAREHGRLGAALVQFATSPLQQLQYETQAFREWMDLKRYGADEERIAEVRARLIRAVFINHVLMPAAMELVIAVFRAIMGDEPRWEKDGYAWDLLRDVLLGQASRIFYVGVLASSVMDALFKRQLPRGSQLIPSEGAITIMANVAVTAHDVMAMDGEKVRKDLERMVKSLAPTRIPYNLYRRVTGDSDVDRKKAKGK